MPHRRRRTAPIFAITGLTWLAVACSDTTGLPSATLDNTVDSVSLFALSGTPVTEPSGFLLVGKRRVRTDQSAVLDFVFDFDAARRPVLRPTAVLGLGRLSALQRSQAPFDAIKLAPTGGWVFDSALVADSGAVLLVRSRPTECFPGLVFSLYAKLQVLAIDTIARRLDFQILVDENCGYRSLEPGVPKQ